VLASQTNHVHDALSAFRLLGQVDALPIDYFSHVAADDSRQQLSGKRWLSEDRMLQILDLRCRENGTKEENGDKLHLK
jgi:hypothetical protein